MLLKLIVFSMIASISCNIGKNSSANEKLTSLDVIASAFKNKQNGIQVIQKGEIIAVLLDDTKGERHQRIVIELANKQTLLIAHNIDIAPRIPHPQTGKVLRFCGEYKWNYEGGVIHFTHRDPQKKHADGWLEYEGKRYE
jgi:hypothetical protein